MEATPPVVSWLTTLSDAARLRLLRLLDREELSVGELARVTQLPQSTVSRHLKALHDGHWVQRRIEGTASYYRLLPDVLPKGAGELWAVTCRLLGDTPTLEEDDCRLAEVLLDRATESRVFFGKVGGEWDHVRRELFGTVFTAEALLGLLPDDLILADLGCGTGNAAELVAPLVQRVIAVDREPAMLQAARRRLAAFENVEFRQGELDALPIDDGGVDVAAAFLVVHHLDDPAAAVAQMARVLRPGGMALIVDMVVHDRETFRYRMGHKHLGFAEDQVAAWAAVADLQLARYRRLRPDTNAKGPGLFAATLRKR